MVGIFKYIRCSITQYSADLHLQVNRNVGKMSFAWFLKWFLSYEWVTRSIFDFWMNVHIISFPWNVHTIEIDLFCNPNWVNFSGLGKILRNTNLKIFIIIFCDMMLNKRKTPIENTEICLIFIYLGLHRVNKLKSWLMFVLFIYEAKM